MLCLNKSIAFGRKTGSLFLTIKTTLSGFYIFFCTRWKTNQTDCKRRSEWLPCLLSDLSCVSQLLMLLAPYAWLLLLQFTMMYIYSRAEKSNKQQTSWESRETMMT